MIPEKLLPSYGEWKTQKDYRALTIDQYFHLMVAELGDSSIGVALALLSIAMPNFLKKGECLFIEEMFSEARFAKLTSQGLTPIEMEYWMNLLNVSSMFSKANEKQVEWAACQIEKIWMNELRRMGLVNREARIVNDDGEIYLTLCNRNYLRT